MKALSINSGFGGMMKGLHDSGFVTVMSIEEDEDKRAVLDDNFEIKSNQALPVLFDLIPKYDLLIARYAGTWPNHDLFFLLEKTRPRVILFQFEAQKKLSPLIKKMEEAGYKTWEYLENSRQWIGIDKFHRYIVAIRNDVRQYFKGNFPFPEKTYFGPLISVDIKGYINCDPKNNVSLEIAKEMMGWPAEWNFKDIHPRHVLMEPSPVVYKHFGMELGDWGFLR
jgi:hypothetical protein